VLVEIVDLTKRLIAGAERRIVGWGGLGLAAGPYRDRLIASMRVHIWADTCRGLPISTGGGRQERRRDRRRARRLPRRSTADRDALAGWR
jgi:hypothetical protein